MQPAAADNGTALGAAAASGTTCSGIGRAFVMEHGYWGPAVRRGGDASGPRGRDRAELRVAGVLDPRADVDERRAASPWRRADRRRGKVVGWFRGPHGVGGAARWATAASSRGPAASRTCSEIINAKIKFREKFRAIRSVHPWRRPSTHYFVGAVPDPFMIQVYPVARRTSAMVIPAVTHVDGLRPAPDGQP